MIRSGGFARLCCGLLAAGLLTACAPAVPASLPLLTVGPAQDLHFAVPGELITAFAFTPDGRTVVVGTDAGRVHALDRVGGTMRGSPLTELADPIAGVTLWPDGQTIVVDTEQGDRVYGSFDGEPFVAADLDATAVAFDRAGARIAFLGSDVVVVLDRDAGLIEATYDVPPDSSGHTGLTFAPGGGVVALRDDGTDTWTGTAPAAVSRPLDCACAITGSEIVPGGALAVFGTADGHLMVLDTTTGQVVADETVTVAPTDRVLAVAVATDGSLVIGVSTTGAGLVWDARAQRVVWRGTFPGRSPRQARFVDSDTAVLFDQQFGGAPATGLPGAPWLVPLTRTP